MFGWLAIRSHPHCLHAPPTLVSRRAGPITPASLLRMLPALGSVLYLHAATSAPAGDDPAAGLLVTQRAFAPLLATRWLVATSAVTDDGPREWLECLNRFGCTQARLHLLPDTDYLAWDALVNTCEPDCQPPFASTLSPFKPDSATVVNFHLRELAGLMLLEQGGAALSPLGGRLAARIARSEAALLLE